jgi:hypothetical protein
MSEHVEMICEGCDVRVVDEEPEVNIAKFLRAALADGWRDIEEQENIPEAIDIAKRISGMSLVVLFDALCPECCAMVKAHIQRAKDPRGEWKRMLRDGFKR